MEIKYNPLAIKDNNYPAISFPFDAWIDEYNVSEDGNIEITFSKLHDELEYLFEVTIEVSLLEFLQDTGFDVKNESTSIDYDNGRSSEYDSDFILDGCKVDLSDLIELVDEGVCADYLRLKNFKTPLVDKRVDKIVKVLKEVHA